MDIRQLQYFEMIYRMGSISKASKAMFVSQQCISRQLANLEKEFHAKLFERNSGGVIPTEEGKYLHSQAVSLLAAAERIEAHFSDAVSNEKSLLTIGIPRGMNFFFDDSFINEFEVICPDISLKRVNLWNTEVCRMMDAGRLDLSFVFNPGSEVTYEVIHLFDEPFTCVVNVENPLAGKDCVRAEDIVSQKILVSDENYYGNTGIEAVLRDMEVCPEMISIVDLFSVYEYVSRNPEWIGFSLRSYANTMDCARIRQLPLKAPHSWWDISLICGNRSHNIDRMIEYIKNRCSQKAAET